MTIMGKVYVILLLIAAAPFLSYKMAEQPTEQQGNFTEKESADLEVEMASESSSTENLAEEIPVVEATEESIIPEEPTYENTFILAGEGGDSGNMFTLAAETYKRQHNGEIYEVRSGDEAIAAFNAFVAAHGSIGHLEYFGHGNEIALFTSQIPGENGALYANDPTLNTDYIAASIYSLEPSLFAEGAIAKFNGCNVAWGHPHNDSFAEKFANHFDVQVVAPIGPTEFVEDGEDVYLLPTYDVRGFITIDPAALSTKYSDVHSGELYEEAIRALSDRGFSLNIENTFKPYQTINYSEAQTFCSFATGNAEACSFTSDANEKIRNLSALKMLVDGFQISVGSSDVWYKPYVTWASANNLLTEDFTNKVTYTRGEMAQLTWNIMQHTSK